MSRRSNFLEADESSREQNLRFVRNAGDEFEQFFGGSNNFEAPPRDYKVVTPRPGEPPDKMQLEEHKEFFRQLGLPRHEVYEWAKRSLEMPTFDLREYRNRRHELRKSRIGQTAVDKRIMEDLKEEYKKFKSGNTQINLTQETGRSLSRHSGYKSRSPRSRNDERRSRSPRTHEISGPHGHHKPIIIDPPIHHGRYSSRSPLPEIRGPHGSHVGHRNRSPQPEIRGLHGSHVGHRTRSPQPEIRGPHESHVGHRTRSPQPEIRGPHESHVGHRSRGPQPEIRGPHESHVVHRTRSPQPEFRGPVGSHTERSSRRRRPQGRGPHDNHIEPEISGPHDSHIGHRSRSPRPQYEMQDLQIRQSGYRSRSPRPEHGLRGPQSHHTGYPQEELEAPHPHSRHINQAQPGQRPENERNASQWNINARPLGGYNTQSLPHEHNLLNSSHEGSCSPPPPPKIDNWEIYNQSQVNFNITDTFRPRSRSCSPPRRLNSGNFSSPIKQPIGFSDSSNRNQFNVQEFQNFPEKDKSLPATRQQSFQQQPAPQQFQGNSKNIPLRRQPFEEQFRKTMRQHFINKTGHQPPTVNNIPMNDSFPREVTMGMENRPTQGRSQGNGINFFPQNAQSNSSNFPPQSARAQLNHNVPIRSSAQNLQRQEGFWVQQGSTSNLKAKAKLQAKRQQRKYLTLEEMENGTGLPKIRIKPEKFGDNIDENKSFNVYTRDYWMNWWRENGWVKQRIVAVKETDHEIRSTILKERDDLNIRATEEYPSILKECEKVIVRSVNLSEKRHCVLDAYGFLKAKIITSDLLFKSMTLLPKAVRRSIVKIGSLQTRATMLDYYQGIIEEWRSAYEKMNNPSFTEKQEVVSLLRDKVFNWLIHLAFKEIKHISEPVMNASPIEDQLEGMYRFVVMIRPNAFFIYNPQFKNFERNVLRDIEAINIFLTEKPEFEFHLCKNLICAQIRLSDKNLNGLIDERWRSEKAIALNNLQQHPILEKVYDYLLQKMINVKNRVEYLKAVNPFFKRPLDIRELRQLVQFANRKKFKYICKYILKDRLRKYGCFSGKGGQIRDDIELFRQNEFEFDNRFGEEEDDYDNEPNISDDDGNDDFKGDFDYNEDDFH